MSVFRLVIMLMITKSAFGVFRSDYPCTDINKRCADSGGYRYISGVKVHRPCWSYVYDKTCQYPSKNDCGRLSDCEWQGKGNCLLKDKMNNCVNQIYNYACGRVEKYFDEEEDVEFDENDPNSRARFECNVLPCMDGNCFSDSYAPNTEMADVISQLQMVANMKDDFDAKTLTTFKGSPQQCVKKWASYRNCCKNNGWGKKIGVDAGCSDEDLLAVKLREEKKCIFVGVKYVKGAFDIITASKHIYCCYPNVLARIINEEGVKQLSDFSLGNQEHPNCGGLTIDQIKKLDFNKMDFKDFHVDVVKKIKMPNIDNMAKDVERGMISAKDTEGVNQSVKINIGGTP